MIIKKSQLREIYRKEAKKNNVKVSEKDFNSLFESIKKKQTNSGKLIKENYGLTANTFRIGDSIKPQKQVGVYTSMERREGDTLRITLTKAGKRFIMNENLETLDNPFSILLGEHFSNSQWKLVNPTEIGQKETVKNPILSENYTHDSRGYEYDKIYWYPTSDSKTAIQELVQRGTLDFEAIEGE